MLRKVQAEFHPIKPPTIRLSHFVERVAEPFDETFHAYWSFDASEDRTDVARWRLLFTLRKHRDTH